MSASATSARHSNVSVARAIFLSACAVSISVPRYNVSREMPPSEGSTATSFTPAERIPEFQYSLAANYDLNQYLSGGLSLSGQTEIINGGRTGEGVNTFSGFVRVRPMDNIVIGLDAYNLFDEIAFRGGGGISDESGVPIVGSGGSVLGRTVRASVTYEF